MPGAHGDRRREVVLAGLIAGGAFLALVANERLERRAFDPVPPARVAIHPGGPVAFERPGAAALTPFDESFAAP